jgi:hypothetical protein
VPGLISAPNIEMSFGNEQFTLINPTAYKIMLILLNTKLQSYTRRSSEPERKPDTLGGAWRSPQATGVMPAWA